MLTPGADIVGYARAYITSDEGQREVRRSLGYALDMAPQRAAEKRAAQERAARAMGLL